MKPKRQKSTSPKRNKGVKMTTPTTPPAAVPAGTPSTPKPPAPVPPRQPGQPAAQVNPVAGNVSAANTATSTATSTADNPVTTLPEGRPLTDAERVEKAETKARRTAARGLANNGQLHALLYSCGVNVVEAQRELSDRYANRNDGVRSDNRADDGRNDGARTDDGRKRGIVTSAPYETGKPLADAHRTDGQQADARAMTAQEVQDAVNPSTPRYDSANPNYDRSHRDREWVISDADLKSCLDKHGFNAANLAKAVEEIGRVWASGA